ncbi:MAG: hypothetical protein NT116_01045 [Candidatus Parcubacteria bacterium]|nr:hypothetical protein [Candidatus Parcubacteria bacterium]
MPKTKKVNFKFSAIIIVFFALLFFCAGCVKQKQQEETVVDSGKENSPPGFAKITIFSDNGETAVSRFENEDKLAFDDMQSEYDQLNIYLTLNSIFAYAGKNFNSPDVWSATAPIILKNVDSGMSLTDYSVIRQEEQTTGVLPCQKFKIVAKGTNMNGTINFCVAKEINKIRLPFVVSFAFGNPGEGGPSWQLKSYSQEKSGVVFVPQCLEPVKCVYIKEPVQAERNSCAARGGQIEQQRTEQGCVTEYKCLTQEEIVSESMSRMQSPGCSINQAVKNKLLSCRKNNQPNFDISKYDENGCALSATCRP